MTRLREPERPSDPSDWIAWLRYEQAVYRWWKQCVRKTIPSSPEAFAEYDATMDRYIAQNQYLIDHAEPCAHRHYRTSGRRATCFDCGHKWLGPETVAW
jgi:hypothetical protein